MPHISSNKHKKSNLPTRIFRILRMLLHTLYGALIAIFILPGCSARQRDFIISRWAKSLLQVMHIHIKVIGGKPDSHSTGVMFVGNHISWIDIHALNSVRAVRFISKAEVRDWPVFGWLAAKANTLFIDRSKKQDTARIVETATESLLAKDCLCYFPEGTTTDGSELKVFKGSLMQAAINANATVWPFVIRYPGADGKPNTDMAYYDDMTLVESMWLILSLQQPYVELEFLQPINAAGYDRRALTLAARHAISSKLALD